MGGRPTGRQGTQFKPCQRRAPMEAPPSSQPRAAAAAAAAGCCSAAAAAASVWKPCRCLCLGLSLQLRGWMGGQQTARQGWRAARSKLGHGAPQHAATASQAGTVRRISCFPAAQAGTRRHSTWAGKPRARCSHHVEAAAALDDAARLAQLLDGGLDLHGCSRRDKGRQGLSGGGGGRRRRRPVRAPKSSLGCFDR